MKGKRFESIQDIEAGITAQLKTLTKEDLRTASERGKNDGISVFKARGSILRGINGNASFTIIMFLFKPSPYFLITPHSMQIVTCESSLFFHTADNYNSCQRKLTLHYRTPTLQRHGSLLLYHFPEQQHVTVRCWKNGARTSRTEVLSRSALLYNASGCSVAASGFQTLPVLLGDTQATPDAPRLYVCARQDCCNYKR